MKLAKTLKNIVTEAGTLNDYLNSRGINPKFVSRDTKISHAKSALFQKWKSDRKMSEETILEASETELLAKYLNSRGINPKYASKDQKIAHSKSGEFMKWKRDHQHFELGEEVDNLVKENHIAIAMGNMLDDEGSMVLGQLEQLERAISMIRSHIGKDYEKQLPAWVQAKITLATDYADTVGNYITSKNEKVTEETVNEAKKPRTTALEKWRKAAAEREKKHNEFEKKQSKDGSGMTASIDRLEKHLNKEDAGINKAKETKFHKKLDTLVHSTFGKRKDEMKMKEEAELDEMINEVLGKDASAGDWIHDFVHSDNPKFAGKSKAERKKMALGAYYGKQNEEFEQLDELKKSTVFSWLKQQPVVPVRKPGSDRVSYNQKVKNHSKSWNRALDRLSGYKPTSENTLDSLAATEAPCDNSDMTNGTSKAAKMVKDLKKKIKEETYDWEKDDKSSMEKPYGKAPKINVTDKKGTLGDTKPEAKAVMSGGTTLTGQPRDMVEIDPSMKQRPGQDKGQSTFTSPTGKKSPSL